MLGYFSEKEIEDEEFGFTSEPCASDFEIECEFCNNQKNLPVNECEFTHEKHCKKCCNIIHSVEFIFDKAVA